MNFGYNGFNPMQSKMDYLIQQKQLIDQQINSLQGMGMPAININNNTTPMQNQNNYDGNLKWVDGEEQARQIANNNMPLILLDNKAPIFYMKGVDGSFKKFEFKEVTEQSNAPKSNLELENKVNNIETKLNQLIEAITGQKMNVGNDNTTNTQNVPVQGEKQAQKGGKSK